MFDKYGNATVPEEIYRAQGEYWRVVKPFLDQLSIVEVRALIYYLDILPDVLCYIIKRQIDMRKEEKEICQTGRSRKNRGS